MEEKPFKKYFFSRGTWSYYILTALVLAALLFGIFDPRKTTAVKKTIGFYGEYKIIAAKQGENIWELTLRKKAAKHSDDPEPIQSVKTVLLIAEKTFKIKNYHPIEEKGKTYSIIITTEEE